MTGATIRALLGTSYLLIPEKPEGSPDDDLSTDVGKLINNYI